MDRESVNVDSLIKAFQFVRSLPDDISMPDVSVDPDGEVALEWYKNPRWVFSVSVGADGTLTYAGIWENTETHGSSKWDEILPQEIVNGIRRVEES